MKVGYSAMKKTRVAVPGKLVLYCTTIIETREQHIPDLYL